VSEAIDKSTHFLNVDLDIYSKSDLAPLLAALGKRVFVLYAGSNRRTFEAHLEITAKAATADAVIKTFSVLIHSLPKPARKLWDTATRRDFNIGLQAALKPHGTEFALEAETVHTAASLKARIVTTVYAPLMVPMTEA